MINWSEFESSAPDIASAGKRLLVGSDKVAIAFLATADRGQPHIAPVCPVFSEPGLYLVASKATPKAKTLALNPAYALHAFLGDNDEEFRITGATTLLTGESDIDRVQSDIPFPAFGKDDPIFHLGITSALWVYWENAGTKDIRPVRKRWRLASNKAPNK